MNREWLTQQVEDGKSITEISQASGKGKTTVRHWLTKYNLVTTGKSGQKALHPVIDNKKVCSICKEEKDLSEFYVRTDRGTPFTYCKSCSRNETLETQHFIKDIAIEYKGGKCSRCGGKFERNQYAFHHLNPEEKDFEVTSKRGISIPELKKELDKCILVCHNCHHEIHHEIVEESGYTNKIKDNSERWNLSKQLHLEATGKDCCENCGYNTYKGSLCIILPEGVKRKNTIHFDKEYSDALKDSIVICQNCLKLNWN